jgi:hypothetical protein
MEVWGERELPVKPVPSGCIEAAMGVIALELAGVRVMRFRA